MGRQKWPGRDILFILARMSQDPVEGQPRFIGFDVLLLDATVRRLDDDFDSPPAATANLDVDFENALESLGPGHTR